MRLDLRAAFGFMGSHALPLSPRQALQKRVAELEDILKSKDQEIKVGSSVDMVDVFMLCSPLTCNLPHCKLLWEELQSALKQAVWPGFSLFGSRQAVNGRPGSRFPPRRPRPPVSAVSFDTDMFSRRPDRGTRQDCGYCYAC